MKKHIYKLLFIYFAIPLSGFAQDIIFTSANEDIKVKVIEINQTDIKYKKFDNINGPTFSINKSDVLFIRYENGTKDVFNESKTSATQSSNSSNSKEVNYTESGINDSKHNYRGQNSGAGWTTVVTMLTSPVIGLIPAAICASNEPQDRNLNANQELMKNEKYSQAYKEEARRTKKRSVWTGYGVGSAGWLVLLLLVY